MSSWRRKAIHLFPKYKRDLTDKDFTIYHLFFDLLPDVLEAHDTNDVEKLQQIYGFAEWCITQQSKKLWNPAGVAFYEHLFDKPEYMEAVLPWLSPKVIQNVMPLWELMVSEVELIRLNSMIASRTTPFNKNLYHTGDIDEI